MTQDDRQRREPWSDWEHYRPLGPILVTFIGLIAWLTFILVYALEWSKNYSNFQNVIVTIVTLVITALVISMVWVVWGMRRARWWMNHGPSTESSTP